MATLSGGLRKALQTRLLDGMIRKVESGSNKWKVLVVDRESLRILSAALQVNELVNEGISIVEMLDMRREPLPRIPALYFITPSAESVQQLASEQATQYREYHIFFTSRLPDFQMDVLRGNVALLRRVRALVELDVAFLALESRLFSLGRPASSLPQIYADDGNAREEMATISERVTEACGIVAPSIDWTVRCDATSGTSKTVASLVKEQLETARIERRANTTGDKEKVAEGGSGDAGEEGAPVKATLLIVDRIADLTTPLVHEYSYQAMAHDLLKLNYQKPGGAHVEVPDEKNTEKKNWLQIDDEENDPVWTDIRSMFIEEALAKAQTSFKEFLETDAAFKIRGKGTSDVDIKDMSAAVRALPNSQLRADKHAMHIRAARDCLELCSAQGLTDLALVEQDLLQGRSSEGTRIRPEAMLECITAVLDDSRVPPCHRIRLVMIALVIAEGLPGLGGENSALAQSATYRSKILRSKIRDIVNEDGSGGAPLMGLEKLLTIASTGLSSYKATQNTHVGGDNTDTVAAKLKQKYEHRRQAKRVKKDNAIRRRRHGLEGEDELEYDVARYHPPLRSVMMDLVDDELDTSDFPEIGSVSVDSIIASLGESSVSDQNNGERSSHMTGKAVLRHGGAAVRSHSASVASAMKGFGRGESKQSAASDDDKFRLAETGHLYMIFVVGGVSYSEVRAMYEVCAKREANIVIGGSSVLTPNAFVEAVGALADPVQRIRVMLPPLPVELAMSRAMQAKALEAGRATSASGKGSRKSKANVDDPSEVNINSNTDESKGRDDPQVEVVVGYKKSRGMRLFGRKKK